MHGITIKVDSCLISYLVNLHVWQQGLNDGGLNVDYGRISRFLHLPLVGVDDDGDSSPCAWWSWRNASWRWWWCSTSGDAVFSTSCRLQLKCEVASWCILKMIAQLIFKFSGARPTWKWFRQQIVQNFARKWKDGILTTSCLGKNKFSKLIRCASRVKLQVKKVWA